MEHTRRVLTFTGTLFLQQVPSDIFCHGIPRLWPWPLQFGWLQLQGHFRIRNCRGSSWDLPRSRNRRNQPPSKCTSKCHQSVTMHIDAHWCTLMYIVHDCFRSWMIMNALLQKATCLHLGWKQEGFNAVFGNGSLKTSTWNIWNRWNMSEPTPTHNNSHQIRSLHYTHYTISLLARMICRSRCLDLSLARSLASMKNRAILPGSNTAEIFPMSSIWHTKVKASAWHLRSGYQMVSPIISHHGTSW